VAPDRVSSFPWAGTQNEHLRLYNEIDIALDTFPYNGTTTTCEALWMGVPVIHLYGDTHRSRVGLSLLRRCGLDELASAGGDEYVRKAVALASDRRRIQEFHSELRSRLSSSSLVDAAGFCRQLESAYRSMIEDVAGADRTGLGSGP
jgi:predicted O-linked N-acetylglucosamine transferase (SPINDLY family)